VGKAETMGGKRYAMRAWLNPEKLASLSLNPSDIVAAIRDQSKQASLGVLGSMPTSSDQELVFALTTKGRLDSATEFEEIEVKRNSDGSIVYLKDVARVELGAENYSWGSSLNEKSVGLIGIYQLPGENALAVKKRVDEVMETLSKRFPEGLTYSIPYDTTKFIEVSIENVMHTLLEAIFLVVIVMYIFLQSLRPTIIATIAIPVSIIGTFAALYLLDFSINFLTLFGMVLAIGIVVDDAILVVEQVETEMHEHPDLPIIEVVKISMDKLAGPIIGTSLVMAAVFIPVSMMPGLVGTMYKQFALTIAISVMISAVNALTLSPAIAALVMKAPPPGHTKMLFHRMFDKAFGKFQAAYELVLKYFIKFRWFVIAAVFVSYGVLYYLFMIVPTGFIPSEDKGVVMISLNMKPGSALPQTLQVRSEVVKVVEEIPGVKDVIAVDGFNIISGTLDAGAAALFVTLEPWDERKDPALQVNAVIKNIQLNTADIVGAKIAAFNVPGIPGLGVSGGLAYRMEDYLSGDIQTFYKYSQTFLQKVNADPSIAIAFTTFNPNYPLYYVDINRAKLDRMGINISDLFSTMQIYIGSFYVNDFTLYGKSFKVIIQASSEFRSGKSDVDKLYVRSSEGQMVPLSSLVQIEERIAPQVIKHYNMYRSIDITALPAAGYSSGQAMAVMEEASAEILPKAYGYEWTGMSLQEKLAGSAQAVIFTLSLLAIFLFLAAMYESWVLPLMVLLTVPVVMLGALYGIKLAGLPNNLYVQIGMVVLMGLASKNAIVVVSFAKEMREEGHSIIESGFLAGTLRFRAILMTVLSFGFGVLPLVLASGAGAMTQRSVGVTIFAGVIIASFVSTVLVPVYYVALEEIRERFVSVDEEIKKRRSL
jgi:hydrophobe/amphiphile efflux-1 (HAE1) family protein